MRKVLSTVLFLFVACSLSLFAEAVVEQVNVKDIDYANASFESIMDDYAKAVSYYNLQVDALMEDLNTAWSKRDSKSYYEAQNALYALEAPSISREATEILKGRILNAEGEDQSVFAQWLYSNSRYYRPVLTYKVSSKTEHSSYNYSSSVSVVPGSELTVKDFSGNAGLGIFAGWGLTQDEVSFKAGDKIQMPYTEQTLYAIFTSGVRFTDEVTGTDILFTEGENAVPVLEAPDASYSFEGWYANGKLLEADTVTVPETGSVTYTAKWKAMTITEVYAKYYENLTIPANQQVKLMFTVQNNGTSSTGAFDCELVSESGLLANLTGKISSKGISSEAQGSFTVVTGAASGSEIAAVIRITDQNGTVCEKPVTIKVK